MFDVAKPDSDMDGDDESARTSPDEAGKQREAERVIAENIAREPPRAPFTGLFD